MAVERVLARVHLAADARAARERADGLLHLRARRVEGRHRRAGPHEHAHVDALGQLGQQLTDDDRRLAADDREVGREVPAGEVDEVARVLHRLGDRGQRLRAVDEDVERATLARRRIAGRPQAVVGRLERPLPPQAPQAPAVLERHRGLDRVADGGVGLAHQAVWPWVGSLPDAWRFDASQRSRRCAARPLVVGVSGHAPAPGRAPPTPGAAARATTTGCSLSLDALAAPHRRRGRTTAETVYGSSSAARARRGARLRSAGSAPGSASAARSSRACPSKRSRG